MDGAFGTEPDHRHRLSHFHLPAVVDRLTAEGEAPTSAAYRQQRIFECIPAALLALAVVCPLLLWEISPRGAFLTLCGYFVYLSYLSLDMAVRQLLELIRMRRTARVDWQARLAGLRRPYERLDLLSRTGRRTRDEQEELAGLRAWVAAPLDPDELWHLVVVPVANEGPDVLSSTLEALANVRYPLDRLSVCLTFETRCRRWTDTAIAELIAPYDGRFGMLTTLRHPDGLPGEAQVKGANISWATKRMRETLHALGIGDEQVVVSVFDCDTRASAGYFGALAWTYLTNPHRDVDSYQPVLLFHNNVWQVPAVSRLVSSLATMWSMSDSTRPGRMRIFASHAAGLRALARVDFWAVNVVPDDSRQYWRMFYGTDGRATTRPLHAPVYLDAVRHHGYLRTLKEQYLQIRRWSYGVIDFPYIMAQNRAHPTIPLTRRIVQTVRQLSGFHKWAITPVLVMVAGQLVTRLRAGMLVRTSVTLSVIGRLQGWTWVAGVVSLLLGMAIALSLLPKRPPRRTALAYLRLGAEWLLLPFVLPVFLSLPALEVQFRLVVRRYLGFRVTVKDQGRLGAASGVGLTAGTILDPDRTLVGDGQRAS